MREQGIEARYVRENGRKVKEREGMKERMNVRVRWVSLFGLLVEGDGG
jgi:hypothetical protein